jgi:hypothetical protein
MTVKEKPFVVVTGGINLVERKINLFPLGVEVATRAEDAYDNACCRWPMLNTFVIAWEEVSPRARMLALLRDRGDYESL